MTAPTIEWITHGSGRRIAVRRLSESGTGRTIIFCHPAPGSGAFDPMPEQTQARNVTLLAADRPGYGASDQIAAGAWAEIGTAADDLAAFIDRDGAGPVGVAGWSAGGRVALALAARRPDLVDRAVILATPAPDEAVPWLSPEQRAVIAALRDASPEIARAALLEQLAPLISRDTSTPDSLTLLAISAADHPSLTEPGVRERLDRMLEIAFAQGPTGLADEIAGYSLRPWGFTAADVRAETLLIYGSRDPIAGTRHGSWWQKHLPDARLEVAPGAGHLLIFSRWERALSHLAPHTRRKR